MTDVPNPGSDQAIAQGCICPVLDNGHGNRDDGLFWVTADCPLHGERILRVLDGDGDE